MIKFPNFKNEKIFDWFSKVPNGYWNNLKNQKYFISKVEKDLNLKGPNSWYDISTTEFRKYGGLYQCYNSMLDMLRCVYPAVLWLPWKFCQVPKDYWESPLNQRFLLQESDIGLKNIEDWYNVDSLKFPQFRVIDQKYNSTFQLLETLYPDVQWMSWNFTNIPQNYWNSLQNLQNYFSHIEKHFDIKNLDDWYKVTCTKLTKHEKLSYVYGKYNSMFKLLQNAYPDTVWAPWKFASLPNGIWQEKNGTFNKRQWMDDTTNSLNIKYTNDWYNVKVKDLYKYSGVSILDKYHSNVMYCLSDLYPENIWIPWKFASVPKNFWDSHDNLLNCIQSIEKELDIEKKEDWYTISASKFKEKSAGLYFYCRSLSNLLKLVYPNYDWLPWKFLNIPTNFWENKDNILKFLLWCEKENFAMKSPQEWEYISYTDFRQAGGNSLLRKYKSVELILAKFYPGFKDLDLVFEEQINPKRKRSSFLVFGKNQYRIYKNVQNLFQNEVVELNYKHPNLVFQGTKKKIEFDVFVPSLNLAFEYQGEQHYGRTSIFGDPVSQQKRDLQKRKLCKKNSITLIEIPYWWDGSESDLASKIQDTRPDIEIINIRTFKDF